MFQKFTPPARQVVVFGQDEARELGHDWIGTEHLLLGLLREGQGIAARALAALGITLDEVRPRVLEVVGRGDVVATGQIPFTPRAKRVLELALRESLTLGHTWIGTEHLLLGLSREPDGVAIQVTAALGADAERIRTEVLRHLGNDVACDEL
jgi:ATP-dependent Clp protease ATP-binding subunit ClpC